MKKYLLLILSYILFMPSLFSQGFVGINTGNYAGVTGVMLQPASIVDSRFKFDINLFSTDARYSNNYFLLNRNVFLKFNKNNFDNYPTFRSKYLSEATLANREKVFFNVSNRTQLPLSFMVTANEKSAFAFNLQSRSLIQGRNISQDLAKLAYNSFYHQPLNDQAIDASGLTLRSLSWVEAGLTYGRALVSNGNHFLKGAFTAKYLGGVSSLNFSGNTLTVQVNSDSTFNFTSDRADYNHNQNADFNRVMDSRFRPDANALGFDAGLVYEYRGHLNNIRYIRNDDEKSHEVNRRDLNKYIFRLGVSILDAGMFRFRKADNVNSFRAEIADWDIVNSRYSSLREFDTALANRVTPLTNGRRQYNVYLPGAFSVQLDIRFVKGLYLNAMAYRPLKLGSEAGTRFNNYGYYSITPRYERRHFGIYIPYTFLDREDITRYRDNWLGLSLRLGPVLLGSSNLGSMAFNQSLKAADFFVGLKIGFTYGKPSKITRLFAGQNEANYKTLATENQEREEITRAKSQNPELTKVTINADTITANRLVVDYSKGQVYTDGKSAQVIIVNNHYYYGNVPVTGRDSLNYGRNIPPVVVQQDAYHLDSSAKINLAQIRQVDSTNKLFNDSLKQKREQLDSLINRLYNLRQRLDSANKEDNSSGFINQQSNMAGRLQDYTVVSDDTTLAQNPKPDDSPRNSMLMKDSVKLNTALLEEESSKKKGTEPSIGTEKQKTASHKKSQDRDNATTADTDTAIAPRQQTVSVDAYTTYMQQSERLQADIERLERQIVYNRSFAYRVAPQPAYNPTFLFNVPPPPTGINLTNVPGKVQPVRDTIVIRDTIFVTKTDTISKNVRSTPTMVIAAVPNEKIVKERIDYKTLPPENILFATGQAVIRQVYTKKLAYLADLLHQNSELMIAITGHTDKTGSSAINQQLSLKRANAVKSFFIRKGISEKRMQVAAVASEEPIVEGDNNNAKMQNRRVEIKMIR